RRSCSRTGLPRCIGAGGQEEDPPGRDDTSRLRVRIFRGGEVLQCVGPTRGADRGRRVGRRLTSRRGGESLTGALRPRRRSHGAGRERGDPVPPGLGEATRGTGRVVRPDRDEHAGTTPPGLRGAAAGDIPQVGGLRLDGSAHQTAIPRFVHGMNLQAVSIRALPFLSTQRITAEEDYIVIQTTPRLGPYLHDLGEPPKAAVP